MASAFEHFVAFGTDNVGLERLLRLIQSICSVLASYPFVLPLILPSLYPSPLTTKNVITLTVLAVNLNVTRRVIRTFRFADTLKTGWTLYAAGGDKSLETWLDILSKTFLGIFGGMETITVIDIMDIEGLSVFGKEKSVEINQQAMYFWFAGLYTSILSSGIKFLKLLAYKPVPETASGLGAGEKTEASPSSTVDEKQDLVSRPEDELKKERERLKGNLLKNKAARKARRQSIVSQARDLGLGMFSDVLDMVLPASAVGWIAPDAGVAGMVMFVTSVTTGMAVYKRCGKKLDNKSK